MRDWWNAKDPNVDATQREHIYTILDWREEHAYPMALTVPSLRNWVDRYSSLDIKPTQRLKRLPRIVSKLARHPA